MRGHTSFLVFFLLNAACCGYLVENTLLSMHLQLYMGLPWSYGSWICNYLCNQCISPQKMWVRNLLMARCTRYNTSYSWRGVLDTTLCCKVYQWLAAGRWFSQSTLASSTNKTDHHHIAEILLKVALNTIIHNQYN